MYLQVAHPESEHGAFFTDNATYQAAINKGLVRPAWPHGLVVVVAVAVAEPYALRAQAWPYVLADLPVPTAPRARIAAADIAADIAAGMTEGNRPWPPSTSRALTPSGGHADSRYGLEEARRSDHGEEGLLRGVPSGRC